MSKKQLQIPGFTPLSDQVFVSVTNTADDDIPEDHPSVVLIFGWGDALPKHIIKFSEGYRRLFPDSKQVIVLSPILKAIWSDLSDRSVAMRPLLENVFGSKPIDEKRVLVHTMSNAGGINCASTFNEYRNRFGHPMPHQFMVLDSTPGSPYLTLSTLGKWSRAMAIGTAAFFPWPFFVTQGIWGIFLAAHRLFERVTFRQSASVFSTFAISKEQFVTKDAHRLYLYSKEDDLIEWFDIESHAADAKQKGYEVTAERFEGSNHVAHMRMFPERYWKLIEEGWKRAVEDM